MLKRPPSSLGELGHREDTRCSGGEGFPWGLFRPPTSCAPSQDQAAQSDGKALESSLKSECMNPPTFSSLFRPRCLFGSSGYLVFPCKCWDRAVEKSFRQGHQLGFWWGLGCMCTAPRGEPPLSGTQSPRSRAGAHSCVHRSANSLLWLSVPRCHLLGCIPF